MNKSFSIFAAAMSLSTLGAFAQSTSLPSAGEFVLTPSFYYQTGDHFFVGNKRMELSKVTGKDSLDQWSTFLSLDYGITDRLAIDAVLGYSEAGLDGGPKDNGWTDTHIGLRYALATEGADWGGPSLTLRAGGIIAGNYKEGDINSVGDGASGWETSLAFDKTIAGPLGLYGDVGFRQRAHDVPDEVFGSAGLYVSSGNWVVSAGWSIDNSTSGGDIGGPGFGKTYGFPQVKEQEQTINATIGYTDGGGRTYTVFGAHTVDGKNTVERDIIGLSISIPFGGKKACCTPTASYSGK